MAENDWDVSKPIDHTKFSEVPGKIRDLKSSTKQIFVKEHARPATDCAGGQHLKGSARVYLQSAVPVLDPEGNSLATSVTADDGRLVCLTGLSNIIRAYIGTSAGPSTGWQQVAAERVYLAQTMNANSKPVIGLPAATQSGSPIHVGQLDTGFFKGITTGVLQVKGVGTYLAQSGNNGLVVLTSRRYVQSATAKGTSDEVCPATWTDMPNMSVQLTTKGGNVLVMFTGTLICTSSTDFEIRFDQGGSPYGTQRVEVDADTTEAIATMHWLFTSVAASTYTFKVQWRYASSGGGAEQPGASYPRILTAIEIPAAA